MCGRYTLHTEKQLLARRFRFDPDALGALEARYNVAPSQEVLVVRNGRSGRGAVFMRWGLIPHWTSDASAERKMINARSETAARAPAYRDAFRRQRCLVLADGFYEWGPAGVPRAERTPHWIRLRDGAPFAMAGLWTTARPLDLFEQRTIRSCAVLTAEANSLIAVLHDRMPVILHPEAEDAWLDPALDGNVEALRGLLVPVPAGALEVIPVSRRVNSPRAEGPELIAPSPAAGF